VRVLYGLAIGGECYELGVVRACRTRIMSDLHLRIESTPEVQTVTGHVGAIRRRAPDVVEVKIEPSEPLTYLPGQFLRVQFRGFPARCYNPTAPMEDVPDPAEFLHLQVQRMEGGHVSPALGSGIREGHQVRMQGPFGSAFLRPASQNRLVLIAGGAGFAPAWSIAAAAIRENPHRLMVMVVGAQTLQSLYMVPTLCMLARFPNVTVIPVVETPHPVPDVIRIGNVTDYIPKLSAEDSVHVCGPLPLVEAVSRIAAETGAACYSVPFVPQRDEDLGTDWPGESRRGNPLSRALDWFSGKSNAIIANDAGRGPARRRSQDRRNAM
jgi:3-phenylpropionate/trans-cinnamate dioxygenase ferredoxin reductase subunit